MESVDIEEEEEVKVDNAKRFSIVWFSYFIYYLFDTGRFN
jgi:hypothetical protein